ncbi:hypothetical protein EJ03DRAFT_188752 [Teratosphaeria nubilosa]|uniref:Uncharacterized protein n=1 Tax=Teratosphaeria nubilosa TaxID=161662 RepID=A0A6G1LJK6_9PEZI|nr:hypothetical protein EJ03DRAFT_188752 [Teratosphaeria nubilosa]
MLPCRLLPPCTYCCKQSPLFSTKPALNRRSRVESSTAPSPSDYPPAPFPSHSPSPTASAQSSPPTPAPDSQPPTHSSHAP